MFDSLFHIQLHIMELSTHMSQMSTAQKHEFLQYLYDEYAAIDDEFIVIVDMLIEALYQPSVESALQYVVSRFTHQDDQVKAELVLNNFLMYIQDMHPQEQEEMKE